jgi:hypothetical protein
MSVASPICSRADALQLRDLVHRPLELIAPLR